jgi:hypothetical protein
MFKPLIEKLLRDIIVDQCNKYITLKCRESDDHQDEEYRLHIFCKAIGAHGLALQLCEKFKIDPNRIWRPDVVMEDIRKEAQRAKV